MAMKNYRCSVTQRQGFTPKLALDFVTLMEKQAKPAYERMGLIIPVISTSTVIFILESQEASLLDIARGLGITHQLAAQRIKTLTKLGIICAHKDTNDKRRTNYRLTKLGFEQSQLLITYLQKADQVFKDLNEELGLDLMHVLKQVCGSFELNSLADRIFKET